MGSIKEDYPGLRAGKLRQLVLIQERVENVDAANAILPPTWKTIAKVWANVTPYIARRGGGEAVYSEALKTSTTHRVVMRFRDDVTSKHRLLQIGSRGSPNIPLNILNVNDPDSRRRQIILSCQSGLNDG